MFSQLNDPPTTLCLSDLSIDALFAGELAGGERLRMDAHMTVCARCRARCAALQEERRRFQAVRPLVPAWLAPEPKVQVRKRHYAALVLAAIALVSLLRPFPEERAKGGELIAAKTCTSARRVSPSPSSRSWYAAPRPIFACSCSTRAADAAFQIYLLTMADTAQQKQLTPALSGRVALGAGQHF